MKRTLAATAAIAVLMGCAGESAERAESVEGTDSAGRADTVEGTDSTERARSLAQRHLIVDTHIDAPYRLYRDPGADLASTVGEREFDYPRAREGGLDVAFMSIFTPARAADAGESRQIADELVDLIEALAAEHPTKFAVATCTRDVERLRGSGVVALALGMENGSPLEGSLDTLDHFVARGIRYLSLAHYRPAR